jgi:hypothetical protein
MKSSRGRIDHMKREDKLLRERLEADRLNFFALPEDEQESYRVIARGILPQSFGNDQRSILFTAIQLMRIDEHLNGTRGNGS